jgi:hypothetical protein
MNKRSGALLIAACALSGSRGEAMQMDLSRAELCQVADAVVLGRVSDIDTVWAATQEGGLERRAFVDVAQTVRGASARSVEVVLPGGTMGEFRHWVEDVPELAIDAHYLLLLAKTPRGWEVIGGETGALRVAVNGFQGVPVHEAFASLGGCNAR